MSDLTYWTFLTSVIGAIILMSFSGDHITILHSLSLETGGRALAVTTSHLYVHAESDPLPAFPISQAIPPFHTSHGPHVDPWPFGIVTNLEQFGLDRPK